MQDGTGGTGGSLNGIRVFNSATPLTISSTVISGNTVVVTTSASISSADIIAGNVTLDYEYGATPHGTTNPPNLANFVFDNSNPQSDTIGQPLQPTNGSIVVTQ